MKSKTIVFTRPKTAELLEQETNPAAGNLVEVKMEYTVVSGGTERACILGMNNTPQKFPMTLGYCGVGYVTNIGEDVTKVKPECAPEIYTELCNDKNFPLGTVFDWRG